MILLDTHALLWWKAGGARLSTGAARAIADADRLLISPITFWEVGMLVAKGRIELNRPVHAWTRDLLAVEPLRSAELSATAAVTAATLPSAGFGGDPADAMIYATAADLGVPLLTKDGALHDFARGRRDVTVLWEGPPDDATTTGR